MTPTPRPTHAAPAPSPANQTTDGAPVADQPAWSYSSPPKATDYGTGAFAHDSHSGKWQRIGPDNKPYGDLIDDQRNGQPRVATDPFGPHAKMDYVPDTNLGRSRMVFSDGTPVPTGKPVYENEQKGKWLNNNDGTYTPLGKDGKPAGGPQTPSGFVRNADGKTAPVDDHGNQFMAKQDKLLPTLPNGQKMFHQPGTDFYTPQAPDGSRMIINGNGKDPSYVDANNKPISPDQYHRALGQGGDGGEPKVTYPEGTPDDVKTQTDDVLHKIWQALGGSTTPTGGVTRTPPGAPTPGAAGQSGATADAIEDSALRQGVAHDAMVNADDRVQQILTDAAANQTATKQAITNMVASLNDDLAALPPDTADSQATLMERINTTLSDASAAVNKALSDAEGAGKNISKDSSPDSAAGKGKDADPKASAAADPDAPGSPAPGDDTSSSTPPDTGDATASPDITDGGDLTSPSPTVSEPDTSAPIAADSTSPPVDDPLSTTPDPATTPPMSPAMNPYANPMSPMGMGGMNPYGGMMDPSMMGATNPLTSGLSGLSGLNPLGGAGATPGLSGLSPTPTPAPSVTPTDTAPSVSSPPADSPSVSPAPSVSTPPTDSVPAPADPPPADSAPADQATPAPPEPAPTDPTSPAHPPAAADAPKPPEDRSVKLPDGTTHDAPTAAAAAAARHALEDKSGAGDAAQAAYANTDVKLPSDGKDLGASVDPSDLQPGDVAKWDDHTAVVVGPGEIADHGEVKQLSEVMGTSSDSFEGFFRPTDAAGADVGGDPTADPTDPATDPGAADPAPADPGADSGTPAPDNGTGGDRGSDSADGAGIDNAPAGADAGDPAPASDSGDPSDAAGDDPSAQPSDPASTDPNLSTTPNSDPSPADDPSSSPSAAPASYVPTSRYSAPPWRRA